MLWCRHSMIPDSGIMLWLVKCLHVGRFVVLLTVLCSFNVKLLLFGKQYRFLCETFCSSLSSKKSKKYICDRLEEENLSIQNVELSWYSPVINNGQNYQFIYAKNACCVQLSLVLQGRLNHNCTEIPCEQLFLSCMAVSIYKVFLVTCQLQS